MTTVTESDLKRIEDLIISGQKVIETRLTAIENSQSEIKSDVKAIQKDVIDLKVEVASIKGDIKTLDSKAEAINEGLKTVDGTQKNQLWALIVILAGAIVTVGFRTFFMGNIP